ncbi:geranylgeranylglyceryl/heptaprenylglyceryl phosphate synthase [bacterium]|nr:geranylgeranylglyceryl/heptaprenylglyceryl phosphate synthase [bacterium]
MTDFNQLLDKVRERGCGHLVLLDPDKGTPEELGKTGMRCQESGVDGLLMGGSLMAADGLDDYVSTLKKCCDLPVFLFPGGSYQLSKYADGLLFLSLLSGRNPQYLIGEQVIAAPRIKAMGLKTVATAYLLIESGATTSVGFISNTQPIPRDKADLAVAHALAAEMLGFTCIYLEAGSGARQCVPEKMIGAVRKHVDLPLIVGGGIRTPEEASACARAGADFIVTGTIIEETDDNNFLRQLTDSIHWK